MVRRSKQQRHHQHQRAPSARRRSRQRHSCPGCSIDFDLLTLASDADTPLADLYYALGSATNGSVTLLGDGYTARFTPTAGFTGSASFGFTLHDTTPDSRTLLNYTFQNSDVTDSSGQGRNATVNVQGTGAATFAASSPLADYTKCLALTENSTAGAARLDRANPGELNLTSADWTLAGWFKRNAATNMDVIAHLGNSGASAVPVPVRSASELQTTAPSNCATGTTPLWKTSPSTKPGEHRRMASVCDCPQRHHDLAYVDGTLAGSDSTFSLNFDTTVPVKWGGANSTAFLIAGSTAPLPTSPSLTRR